jgi:ABC-type transporter Mla maintaining outer membrane lipid asymmetry ATPase subunit MlaF
VNTRAENEVETTEPESRENLLVPDVERWSADDELPIIRLENVHKAFGENVVIDGLDLDIATGEITVIIGASGSGKSVLIKLMNGLLEPDKGRALLFGKDTRELSDVALDRVRKRIGTLFQNYALFDSMTVLENVAFPLVENKAMSESEAHELSSELLEDLGLGEALDLYPASLSGGMKKRVSLARAIISNPEVVLFDEPTTGLDPIMMEFVDNMILEITNKYGLTNVVISHDMASTMRLADSIAVLHGGEIIAHDTPEVIRKSDDERVQSLLRGAKKTDIRADQASDVDLGHITDYAVVLDDVHKSFGDNEVLKGVSLTVPNNRITVVIGGSGSGKSVMMKHILGLMQPDHGSVTVLGRNLAELSESQLRTLRTNIGMLFQHAALFDSMSVADNIAFPLVERGEMGRAAAYEKVDELLEKLQLSDVRDRSPSSISSGQQKRVSLARALISEPDLMIYDEPTTGQDPILSKYVEDMIVETQENFDLTSIVISHDMASTFRIGDKVALLHRGELITPDTPAEMLEMEDERVREFVFASEVSDKQLQDAE